MNPSLLDEARLAFAAFRALDPEEPGREDALAAYREALARLSPEDAAAVRQRACNQAADPFSASDPV